MHKNARSQSGEDESGLMLAAMTMTSDIPLPSGLRRLVDDLLVVVRIGVRGFRRGGEHANAPAGEAVSLLRRLTHILRFAFVILAVHLDLPPLRGRGRQGPTARRMVSRKPAFRLFPRYRVVSDGAAPQPQPAALAAASAAGGATSDRILRAQRKLDALRRALSDPAPLIRRMARRLPAQLMVIGWRPPKRPPRLPRPFWEELCLACAEARAAVRAWRRRTRDTARLASAP